MILAEWVLWPAKNTRIANKTSFHHPATVRLTDWTSCSCVTVPSSLIV
jgi:hypothetical protein